MKFFVSACDLGETTVIKASLYAPCAGATFSFVSVTTLANIHQF